MQNATAAKATTTINRNGTIRNIFTFEKREHLVMSADLTQYTFGGEGGGAGKEACASLNRGSHQDDVERPEEEVQRNSADHLGPRAFD